MGLDVGVSSAIFDCMADFLAAGAPHILPDLLFVVLMIFGHIFVLIILGFVWTKLAAGLLLALLTTAPPHLATVRGLMIPTAPIEVFLLLVLLAAVFACLVPTIEFALPLDELLDSGFLLFFLSIELPRQPLQVEDLLLVLGALLCQCVDFLCVGRITLLTCLPVSFGF